jgi:hypothetical protein
VYHKCSFYNISHKEFVVIKNESLICKNCCCEYNEDTKQLDILVYNDVIPDNNINFCLEKIQTLIDRQVDYEILTQKDDISVKLLMTRKNGFESRKSIFP